VPRRRPLGPGDELAEVVDGGDDDEGRRAQAEERIVDAVRTGASLATAVGYAGVYLRTRHRWLAEAEREDAARGSA
jgi:hypothetical protein